MDALLQHLREERVLGGLQAAPVGAPDGEVLHVLHGNTTHRITRRSVEAELQHQEAEARRLAAEPLVLVVGLRDTRHRTRLLRLRPAISYLQNNVKYKIVKGNEGGTFGMSQEDGVTSLFFKRRLGTPASFDLEITGRPLDYTPLDALPRDLEDFDVNLRIIVMH